MAAKMPEGLDPMKMDHTKTLDPTEKKDKGIYYSTMRWIEDTYLKYFGENRTSYGVKDTFKKGEVSGNEDIDGAQRAVGETVGNQFGAGGVGQPVGDALDKGVLRGRV